MPEGLCTKEAPKMKTLMVSHLWQLLRVPPAGTPIPNRGTVSQGRTGELPGRLTPRLQVACLEGTTFHLLRVPFPEPRLCTLLVFGGSGCKLGFAQPALVHLGLEVREGAAERMGLTLHGA